MNLSLDWSFYNWDLISNFVLKGLAFSLMLTVIATVGGVFFGTLLALMRLSGKEVAGCARHHLRERYALHSAGDGDFVVLSAGAHAHWPPDWRRDFGHHHLHGL